jgi:hypothetical protein
MRQTNHPTTELSTLKHAPSSTLSFVRINMAAEVLGLTTKAIRRKIEDGIWRSGLEYHRDPQGCIWIDIESVNEWVKYGRRG